MPTDNIADLKYLYYGGGTDAEVAYLQAARDAGVTAAGTVLSGVALGSIQSPLALTPFTTSATPSTTLPIPHMKTAAFLRPAGLVEVSTSSLSILVPAAGTSSAAILYSTDGGTVWTPLLTQVQVTQFTYVIYPATYYGVLQALMPSTATIPVGTSIRLALGLTHSNASQVCNTLGGTHVLGRGL